MNDDKIVKVAAYLIVGSVVAPIVLGVAGAAIGGTCKLVSKVVEKSKKDSKEDGVIVDGKFREIK